MKQIITVMFILIMASQVSRAGYKVGDEAADFSLKNVDGKMVSLKNMKDAKGFIVIFTCNHCPFAKAYEERIIELDNKYRSQGFPVVAINPNDVNIVPEDSYENMIKRSAQKKYSFPYLYDESQETAKAYGATRTPHVFVLKKEGEKYIVEYIGAIDNNSEEPEKADKKYVEDALHSLMDGSKIEVTETKAVGCGIKWKN